MYCTASPKCLKIARTTPGQHQASLSSYEAFVPLNESGVEFVHKAGLRRTAPEFLGMRISWMVLSGRFEVF
jgi:hypothetical protein